MNIKLSRNQRLCFVDLSLDVHLKKKNESLVVKNLLTINDCRQQDSQCASEKGILQNENKKVNRYTHSLLSLINVHVF